MWARDRLMFGPPAGGIIRKRVDLSTHHVHHEAIPIENLGPLSREEPLYAGKEVDFRGRLVVSLTAQPIVDSGTHQVRGKLLEHSHGGMPSLV